MSRAVLGLWTQRGPLLWLRIGEWFFGTGAMEASDNTMVINTRYPKAFLCPLCHSGVPEPQEGWGPVQGSAPISSL